MTSAWRGLVTTHVEPCGVVIRSKFNLVILLALLFSACAGPVRVPDSKLDLPLELSQDSLEEIAKISAETLKDPQNAPLPKIGKGVLHELDQPVYVVLRTKGRRMASAWGEGGSWAQNIQSAIKDAVLSLPGYDAVAIDSLDLCLSHSYQNIDWGKTSSRELTLERGLKGLELRADNRQTRYAPTTMLEKNFSFRSAFRDFVGSLGRDPRNPRLPGLETRLFSAYQVRVERYESKAQQMLRGHALTRPTLSKENIRKFRNSLKTWMEKQVEEDGRFPYRYLPGLDRVSDERKPVVREYLVTWALATQASDDPSFKENYLKNLRTNLNQYYRTDGIKGYQREGRRFPLGPLALAGLAILDGPDAEEFQFVHKSIQEGLQDYWSEDGRLNSYISRDVEDTNQDYYPGEALLYWATLYGQNPRAELKEKFQTSISYYRQGYEKAQSFDFIPWQAVASYRMWTHTQDRALLEYLFLLADDSSKQFSTSEADPADLKGRFQRPEQLPSANTTGSQLMAISVAYKAALKVKDKERASRYRDAFRAGLSNLIQHQYQDPVDLFCARNPQRCLGGLKQNIFRLTLQGDTASYPLLALSWLSEDELDSLGTSQGDETR